MSETREKDAPGDQTPVQSENAEKRPLSLAIASKGVQTGSEFANLMSVLMSDIIEGRITPAVGNAACNAGGKLLKVVEMQWKYGTPGPNQGEKVLKLATG
jgi:hypothetical protein